MAKTIDMDISGLTIQAAMETFGNYVVTALTLEMEKAKRLEGLCIEAGKHRREALEDLVDTLTAVMGNDA